MTAWICVWNHRDIQMALPKYFFGKYGNLKMPPKTSFNIITLCIEHDAGVNSNRRFKTVIVHHKP